MNAEELAANPAATERVVHDLTTDPSVPLPDADVDARGWLLTDDEQHGLVVSELVRRTGYFDEPRVQRAPRPVPATRCTR